MKKIFFYLLISFTICSWSTLHAQSLSVDQINEFIDNSNLKVQDLSIDQTKEILYSYKWRLRRYERDGNMYSVSAYEQGMRVIFRRDGEMYFDYPSDPDKAIDSRSFTFTKDKIYYGDLVEDPRISYKLDYFLGYTLNLSYDDSNENIVYVFEQDESIANNNYPQTKSILIGSNRESYDSTPADAFSIIESINTSIKEAIDNITMYWEGGNKYTLVDASFSVSEMGVKYLYKLQSPDGSITEYSREFMPEEIKKISQPTNVKGPPNGLLYIELYSTSAHCFNVEKKKVLYDYYTDEFNIIFLKVDPNNYTKIEHYFNKLKDIYASNRRERLELLESFMDEDKDYWVSYKGTSQTYKLDRAFVTGSTIRLHYDLKTVSTNWDSEGYYITEIPLNQIEDITYDKSKSRPNTIILHSGKDGFKTYRYDDSENDNEDYNVSTSVNEIPLFIDVSSEKKRDRVVELLKTHVKESGGKNLKLKKL